MSSFDITNFDEFYAESSQNLELSSELEDRTDMVELNSDLSPADILELQFSEWESEKLYANTKCD